MTASFMSLPCSGWLRWATTEPAATPMEPQFGEFAPPRESRFLRLLIRLRCARGILRKIILRNWQRRFGPLVDITARGIRYRLNIRDNLTDRKILAFPGGPDRPEIAALAAHCRGGAFVDIGANTGLYSLTLATLGASRVLAIEPSPRALARLHFNIAINGAENRVAVVAAAVGTEGAGRLSVDPANIGRATLLQEPFPGVDIVPVAVRCLASILKQHNISRVAGLKIDTEGTEDCVLLPFFQATPRTSWPACVVIEHKHNAAWKQDVIASMLDSGYRVHRKTRENTILEHREIEPVERLAALDDS